MVPNSPSAPALRRGQLALTRLLPGGDGASSPQGIQFPARVPRRGEAAFAIALCFALVAAALVVVFPVHFAGAGAMWLLPVVPALVHLEIFAAAVMHALTAPRINGRIWFGAMQVATCLVAASGPGWPRAIALLAAALTLAEIMAASIGTIRPPRS